jgi:hypothetical protein
MHFGFCLMLLAELKANSLFYSAAIGAALGLAWYLQSKLYPH